MRTSSRRARAATLTMVTSLIGGWPSAAQEPKTTRPTVGEAHQVMSLTPAELTWTAGPPMLPPGARMALIEGAPDKPGPFTFRLKFPANYRIPAHWHPRKTTVTVISGTFHMGHGDKLDTANGKVLPAGSIFEMPPTIHHFGWASEETIIQHHGIGPFTIQYLKLRTTRDKNRMANAMAAEPRLTVSPPKERPCPSTTENGNGDERSCARTTLPRMTTIWGGSWRRSPRMP